MAMERLLIFVHSAFGREFPTRRRRWTRLRFWQLSILWLLRNARTQPLFYYPKINGLAPSLGDLDFWIELTAPWLTRRLTWV